MLARGGRPLLAARFDGRFSRWPMLARRLIYGIAILPGDFISTLAHSISNASAISRPCKSIEATGILGIATNSDLAADDLGYAFQTAYCRFILPPARKEPSKPCCRWR